jgi:hypothetical protein
LVDARVGSANGWLPTALLPFCRDEGIVMLRTTVRTTE